MSSHFTTSGEYSSLTRSCVPSQSVNFCVDLALTHFSIRLTNGAKLFSNMWESEAHAWVDSNESKSSAGGGGGNGMNMLYHAFMNFFFFFFFPFSGISTVVEIWWQLLLHILHNFLVPSYIKSCSYYFFLKSYKLIFIRMTFFLSIYSQSRFHHDVSRTNTLVESGNFMTNTSNN